MLKKISKLFRKEIKVGDKVEIKSEHQPEIYTVVYIGKNQAVLEWFDLLFIQNLKDLKIVKTP